MGKVIRFAVARSAIGHWLVQPNKRKDGKTFKEETFCIWIY
jgi:hypothetical protein